MGFLSRVFVSGIVLVIAFFAYKYYEATKPLPLPQIDVAAYWGPGSKANYKEDTSIKPFKINYSGAVIDDLKQQLSRPIAFHKPLEGVAFQYGFNTDKLKEIITYWRDSYLPKWNTRQEYLSKFPHFTTQIQGLQIHFIHKKVDELVAKKKKVLPLLLVHGWPGSVREFYDIIPSLTTGENSEYAFEVIAPSIPGYGWSEGASKTGLGAIEIAVILRNLMLRLGHKEFFYQGGDWGSLIGSNMATIFPDNIIGYHSNICFLSSGSTIFKRIITSFAPSYFIPNGNENFFFPASEKFAMLLEESGYMHLQATKPDTIGTALIANPIGLAAYILEKFSTWTNQQFRTLPDAGLEKYYSMDALLDNVMIYYLSNSITTSVRLYSESFSMKQMGQQMDRVQTNVPFGCARFRHDLMASTDWELKEKYTNLVHSTYYNDGGHFIALERPKVLYDDFISFAKKVISTTEK